MVSVNILFESDHCVECFAQLVEKSRALIKAGGAILKALHEEYKRRVAS